MTEAEEIDRTMRASFDRIERAQRYREWILDQIRPILGRRVLEVGAGIGNITVELLRDRERVVALDPQQPYLDMIERRLGDSAILKERLTTIALGLEDPALASRVHEERLDSALLLNVLEHIDDDVAALENLSRALGGGASVVIQVPAHSWLYGEADRALGHVRRYSAAQLRETLSRAGLRLRRIWQFNALGVLGWLVSGRLQGQSMFSRRQLEVYELLVPLLRRLEPERGVPVGLSLMAHATTPVTAAGAPPGDLAP
jgi:SAM-dependent methyltransferase